MNKIAGAFLTFFVLLISAVSIDAQSTTANMSGNVDDEQGAAVAGAAITISNTETGFTRTVQTNAEGRYRVTNLPVGLYSVTVAAPNFSNYIQNGIRLVLNQEAVVNAVMKVGGLEATVTITENAALINTTTAEISTRFDEKRLSELPISTNRNVLNILLSVPGVSQLGSGQSGFANGISFSANGGRLRSNNFMLDGQDINDPSVSGGQIALNNPDAIGEVRIITNQFLAEYGRNSGSVVNFVGKTGTNTLHGSAFWFHNNKRLNACSNLDKGAGNCNPNATNPAKKFAPFRLENQIGFTVGGPLYMLGMNEGGPAIYKGRDKTFFFVDYQKWSDRALGSGFTLNGAPTEAGRQILQTAVGNRPQVQALLRFVPAGTANGTSKSFTANGQTYVIPLGNLTGSSAFKFDDTQGSARVDHRINDKNSIYGRYRWNKADTSGTGQVTPPGLTTTNALFTQAATGVWNSIVGDGSVNEFRIAYTRYNSITGSSDPTSESIPSIEISDLGMTGFNAAASRTAIGLAVNLPQYRINDTYQLTDNFTMLKGNHSLKFGVDWRWTKVESFFFPTVRGRLAYSTLQNFVDDFANTAATVNRPLRGGEAIGFYKWWEIYGYFQDEWRIKSNFTLSYGLRYEYPGDSFTYLKDLNARILTANANDPRYVFTPVPKADKNNLMPRIGFNWNPRFSKDGAMGLLTGGDQTVIRGGYSRVYDASFININLNVFSSFPFVAAGSLPAAGAFVAIQNFIPNLTNPNVLTRTIVGEDFRAPSSDQFSLEMQRGLTPNTVFKLGYIGTKGRGLFQTIDGNPRTNCGTGTPANPCPRADPTRGVIRLRANAASSDYHSMQTGIEKRLSNNFSAGLHYTWSSFIDTASEIFNPSGAEVAVAQDSFNRNADRARSSYDRPHRITGNFVYQIPFFEKQNGFAGRILGGWQVNSFFSLQSGAPFTPLNGTDLAAALNGIDGLVGSAIRPNINSSLNLSRMTIEQLRAAGGAALFSQTTQAQRVGNAGRNILRSDGIESLDFGVIKNTMINERVRIQLRMDMFNALNHRVFGVPEGRINAGAFLNQWATNGGNRRIVLGGRLVF